MIDDQREDWPTTGEHLAWSPDWSTLAVPLRPGETSMTWGTFLSRLYQRVRWMEEQAGPAAESIYEEEWGKEGERKYGSPSANLTSDLQDPLLREAVDRLEKTFPRPVENQPEAVEEIEQTDLQTWLLDLIPANRG